MVVVRVEAVEVGRFVGPTAAVFFQPFEDAEPENATLKVSPVQPFAQNCLVQLLEFGHGELFGEKFVADGLVVQLQPERFQGLLQNLAVVEDQGGHRSQVFGGVGRNHSDRNGLAFKHLNKNDTLDTYEDWRLSVEERARDLADKLPVAGMAGLMLYSRYQSVPTAPGDPFSNWKSTGWA